ncbi:unnamed protein product [Polarella glacialis]|uniref:Spondin-like TSP1 domain-containing protein n=1 Tax=Polarella glacialis TaxID=89957 RepID=A0A813G5T7_POLGL|nr:unnamed protein product [Polarella glacialis]
MARLAEVALLFLVLLPVSSQLAGQGAGGVAPLVAPANCQGREQEWATCEGLPSCGGCVPHDCSFAAWNEWFKLGGCTGLCVRKRMVREANNECGNPCNGAQMETVHRLDCYPDIEDCILKPRNCTWKDWGDWSACLTTQGARNRLGQRYRKRTVEHVALNSGQVCAGPFNETEPCSASAKVELNCELSEWGAWTHCSASCAGGWQARMRRITQHALHGGTTCQEVTRMMQPCNVRACGGSRGCVMGEWEAWQGCDLLSPAQRYRSRKLTQPAEESGPPCNQPLQETQGCPDSDKEPVACQLSTWSAWGACSASCGGQAERTRGLQDDQRRCVLDGASAAGASLHEIKPCGVAKCFRGQCHTSDWTEWSSCSQHCGQGIHSRSREVLAVTADQGCDIALEEVKPCQLTPCTQIDCVWGEWDHFSACSDSCGGGSMRRIRVVKQPPRSGGKGCEAKDKSEIAPCNTETCQVCIDGRWGTWGAWSKCSATCSPSYRARHRSVEMHPNFCGRPADGVEDQYEVCQSQPNCQTSEDCLFSDWNEWTSCSCKCFGVRERLRSVARYATGNGKTCLKDSLKQVEPCSPGPGEAMPADCEPDPKRPCQVGEWEDWLGCSTSCGGGERKRSRGIMVPAADDGPPCEAALQHVEPCSTQDCHRSCVDCHWGAWSGWGECSKCGGQRYRHRAIETMPNHCGKKCIAAAAKELGSCQSHCAEKVFCTWSDWSEMGGCSAECGPSTKLLQRQLRLTHDKPNPKVELMAGTGGMCRDAAGQTYSGCPVLAADEQTCKKILLELAGVPGVRGAMFAPKSFALARAGRSCVLQVDAGAHVNASAVEGGWMAEPCIQGQGSGPIVEAAPNSAEASWSCMKLEGTAFLEGDSEMPCSGVQLYSSTCPVRPCEDQCSPEDCVLSQWSEWSAPSCTQLCERSRVLQKQNECGGKSCDGQLVDTKRCWKNCTAPVDCLFGDWSYWEPLTCVSEVDQKERSRTVLRTAKNGGENCEGPVRETLPCSGTPTLVADCLLGSWADWTACNRPCDQGLRTRSRVVAVQAQGGGQPCDGTLAEMQPCSLGPCERAVRSDGEFAPWSTWGDCSPSNMRVRTRKVAQEPTGGGKAAIGSVEETAECSEIMDCKVSDWTNWDLCDRSCGGGQQQRQRQVQGNPRNGGMKCPANLIETRGCKEEPCRAVDCEVTHWSDWASCSADCGNGYRERQRSIETLAEANGAGQSYVSFCPSSSESLATRIKVELMNSCCGNCLHSHNLSLACAGRSSAALGYPSCSCGALAQPPQSPPPCEEDCLAEALADDPTKGCLPGTYWTAYPRNSPAESCQPCPSGSYCPGVPYGNFPGDPVNLNRRLYCPAGTFNNKTGSASLAECSGCAPGRYNDYHGRYSCIDCPAGTYSGTAGSSCLGDCLSCPAAHWCVQACILPVPCPNGTYLQFTGIDGPSYCVECTRGNYCPLGTVLPLPCPGGSYGNGTGIIGTGYYPGTFVPVGWTSSSGTGVNGSGCTSCPAAFFCVEGGIVPRQCPAGTYSQNESAVELDCLDCPVGHRCQMPTTTDTLQSSVVREANGVSMGGSAAPEACTYDTTVRHYLFPDITGCVDNCPYNFKRQSYCHVPGDGRSPDPGAFSQQVVSLVLLRGRSGQASTAQREAALVNLTAFLSSLTAEECLGSLTDLDGNGRTPMILAAMLGDMPLLRALWGACPSMIDGPVAHNASAARDAGGFTSLMHTVLLDRTDATAWLLAAGAKLTLGDATALQDHGIDTTGLPIRALFEAPAYLGRGGLTWTHPLPESFVPNLPEKSCALPLSELGECQGAEENCNGGVSCDCAWAGWSDWSSCTCDCNGGRTPVCASNRQVDAQSALAHKIGGNGKHLCTCWHLALWGPGGSRRRLGLGPLIGTWTGGGGGGGGGMKEDSAGAEAEVSRPAHPEGARTGLQARALECAMLFAQLRVGGLLGNPQSEGPVYFFSAMFCLETVCKLKNGITSFAAWELVWRGRPPTGNSCVALVKSCKGFGISCVPSQDCEFGGWSVRGLYSWQAWGACSESCDGVKRRSRTIKQQGRGEGAFCEGPLKQTYPCSTGVGLLEFSSPSLYLNLQKLAVNSLSGKGEMRFSEVATVPGENCVGSARTCPGTLLDLLIKPSGKYFPGGSSGLFGEVGSISTAVGSTAVLDLHLVERVGADDLEVKPKMLMLKFFDVSDGVTLEVDGYDQVFLSAESQLQVQEESSKSPKGPRSQDSEDRSGGAFGRHVPYSARKFQRACKQPRSKDNEPRFRVTFANRIGVGQRLSESGAVRYYTLLDTPQFAVCRKGMLPRRLPGPGYRITVGALVRGRRAWLVSAMDISSSGIVSACGRGEDAVDCARPEDRGPTPEKIWLRGAVPWGNGATKASPGRLQFSVRRCRIEVRSRKVQSLNSHGGRPCREPSHVTLSAPSPVAMFTQVVALSQPNWRTKSVNISLATDRSNGGKTMASINALHGTESADEHIPDCNEIDTQVQKRSTSTGKLSPQHRDAEEMKPCESQVCAQEWGACDKCGGQMKRFRRTAAAGSQSSHVIKCGIEEVAFGSARSLLLRFPMRKPGAAEEIAECPRKCHELSYCAWGDWSPYSECTNTCGEGMKSRNRRLKVVNDPLGMQGLLGVAHGPADLEQKFQQLDRRATSLEAQRRQQLGAAFSAGFLGLVAMVALGRRSSWFSGNSNLPEHQYSAALMNPGMSSDGE